MKLIINADDLGYTKGINYGIYDAYINGVVSSTSLMMNMPHTDHAIELFKGTSIGMGVHLNISEGKPLTDAKALVNEEGFFLKDHKLTHEVIEAIEKEFVAQIDKGLDIGVSHITSFNHSHLESEVLFKLVLKLANQYDLKMRCDRQYAYAKDLQVPSTAAFTKSFYDQGVHIEMLIQLIEHFMTVETLEVSVHPGFLCGHLIHRSSYREMRMVEHSILTSDYLKSYLTQKPIELIDFNQIERM